MLAGVGVFVLLCLVIVVISLRGPRNLNELKTPSEAPRKIGPIDEAVLTIVGLDRSGSAMSQGSGFVLSSDGLAGSNYHVLRGVTEAVAECCNGRKFEIRSVEGADLSKDLVVFQLYERGSSQKPQDLPYVTLGSSSDVSVGEKVIAVGSPQGLENTVSDGILSAVREYESVRYLQITAPISPGSSGGPVLNASGKVVGVATFQFERGQNPWDSSKRWSVKLSVRRMARPLLEMVTRLRKAKELWYLH
jgi:S1-C subfamily serine protease